MEAGTLLNLSQKLGNVKSINEINNAIKKGDLAQVDLRVEDITEREIKGLPKNTTSSNFGKLQKTANENDLMIGIANMIFETIGMMAVFATQNTKIKNIIVIGNAANIPYINEVLSRIENLHKGIQFIIPKNAEYAVAIGAIKALK